MKKSRGDLRTGFGATIVGKGLCAFETAHANRFVLVVALACVCAFALPTGILASISRQDDPAAKVTEDADGEGKSKRRPDQTASTDNLPFKKRGAFEKTAKYLDDFVRIKYEGDQLELQGLRGYENVGQAFDKYRSKLGYGNGSNGHDYFELAQGRGERFSLSTDKLFGQVSYLIGSEENPDVEKKSNRRKSKAGGDRYRVYLEEIGEQRRSLEIVQNDLSGLTVTIRGLSLPYMFRLNQSPDGNVTVYEIEGDKTFFCRELNFTAFMQVHASFAGDRMLPLLSRFGISHIRTPYASIIRQQVLLLLSPLRDDELKTVHQLVQGSRSADFSKRNSIVNSFPRKPTDEQLSLLLRAVVSPKVDAEVRYRIQQICTKRGKSSQLSRIWYANSHGLQTDVEYLFWLLGSCETVEQRDLVTQQLFRLQQLAVDDQNRLERKSTNAAWLASRQASFLTVTALRDSPTRRLPPIDQVTGAIEKAKKQMGQLFRLTVADDNLVLDHKHWTKPFGGKSVKTLSQEMEDEVKKRNLPEVWYRPGWNESLKSTGHHHILFQNLAQEFGCYDQGHEHDFRYSSPYMQQDSESGMSTLTGKSNGVQLKLFSKLKVGSSSSSRRSRPGDPKRVLYFSVEETKMPRRWLEIEEDSAGFLRLQYENGAAGVSMTLITKPDQTVVWDLRDDSLRAFSAGNFSELLQQHPDYFRDEFGLALTQLGVLFETDD